MINIPIFLSADNNYAPFVATTIASICDNTTSFCNFYILDGGITDKNKGKICNLKKHFNNFSIEFLKINLEEYFKKLPETQYISKAMYSRFLIPELKPEIDKAIYLDVDVIALGDIAQMYNEDLKGYALGATWEKYAEGKINQERKEQLNLSHEHKYFCSGSMVIDCKIWRKNKIFEKLVNTYKSLKIELICPDQDILNKFFDNNYKIIDTKYCYINQVCAIKPYSSNTVIRHFNGPTKPWMFEEVDIESKKHPATINHKDFWNYARITDFYEKLYNDIKFKNIHELKKFLLFKKLIINHIRKHILVSIIIPIYKVEPYLKRCLDSVCGQTLRDIEIICINDCSPDNSLEILKEYQKNDNRIKIIDFKENRGVAAARNEGIKISKGEYIGFVDSDDWIDLDFYEKLYKKAKITNANIVKSNVKITDNQDQKHKITSKNIIDIQKNKIYFIHAWSAIYKKSFINQFDIKFADKCKRLEDTYFEYKAAINTNKIEIEQTTSYHYEIREHSLNNVKELTINDIKNFEYALNLIYDLINQSSLTKEDYKIFLEKQYKYLTRFSFDKIVSDDLKTYIATIENRLSSKILYKDLIPESERRIRLLKALKK